MNTIEFLRLEARNALSTPNLTASIYNTTTFQKPKPERNNELFTFPWQRTESATREKVEDEDQLHLRHFHNLPSRTPVDLQFKDISYFVESGIRKSKSIKLLFINNLMHLCNITTM